MKDGKTIIIKDQCLRNIRNSLRVIIKKAKHLKIQQYSDDIRKLMHIRNYRDGKLPTPEEEEQAQKLINERARLDNKFKMSIIYCQYCKSWDKDMKYFSKWAEWVCVDCYDGVVKRWEHAEKLRKESEEHGW
jgi:hypothetical protein